MNKLKRMNGRERTFLLITIPILALFFCFNTLPLIKGVIYSFTNFRGYGEFDWAAGPFQFAMINPVITRKSGAFETEEGCLSLDGVRSCTRYEEIEVDHCNGIVI